MKQHTSRPQRAYRPLLTQLCVALMAAASGQAFAQATPPDAAPTVKLSGGLAYGAGIRASEPDPSLLFTNNAPLAGLSSTNTGGRNQDDGNMNFRKGDVFTHAAKAFADLDLAHGNLSAQLRVLGWHDFRLADGDVPWGHTPNGLRPDAPLSDAGARERGKFSNIVLSNAWVRWRARPMDTPVALTLGQQRIGWRGQGISPGPLAVLDPVDFTAQARPGSFPEESSIPVPALRAAFSTPGGISFDAFYQFGFRANQTPLCGTFFAAADRTLDGCDKTMVNAGAGALSDRALLAANRFVTLGTVNEPSGSGQFGVSARWRVPDWNTDLGVAYARYDSRSSFTNMVKSRIPGANPFAPADPRNPQTQVTYPEGIQTLAFDFKHDMKPATLYGSLGYTPNQPMAYPGGEVFQAFVAPVGAASLFRAQERATTPGAVFEGWDRRRTSDWQLGFIRPVSNVLGAANMTLRAEVNAKVVHDLPDPATLRYGRAEVFGIGPINGACAAGASAITCTNEGYVTRSAWGYVLQAVATYPNAIGSINLRPRLSFAHNVNGTSHDGSLREGRKTVVLGLDALYGKSVFNLTFVRHNGGTYDAATDRDYIAASFTTRF